MQSASKSNTEESELVYGKTTQHHYKLENPPDNTLVRLKGHFTDFTHEVQSLIMGRTTQPVKTLETAL